MQNFQSDTLGMDVIFILRHTSIRKIKVLVIMISNINESSPCPGAVLKPFTCCNLFDT